jgi:hypothetical protein
MGAPTKERNEAERLRYIRDKKAENAEPSCRNHESIGASSNAEGVCVGIMKMHVVENVPMHVLV